MDNLLQNIDCACVPGLLGETSPAGEIELAIALMQYELWRAAWLEGDGDCDGATRATMASKLPGRRRHLRRGRA